MASNLIAMASNLKALAPNLIAIDQYVSLLPIRHPPIHLKHLLVGCAFVASLGLPV